MPKYLTRTVVVLSLVSLFADMASEMLYPVMPLFMEGIGFGVVGIGLLEGLATLIAGFGNAWFGSLSDQLDRRYIFIRGGYLLSAIGRPIMGLFPTVGPVFAARSLGRLGKGMRGAARDAVLVADSDPKDRGKVFGFHRSMDTLGAVIGPALALLYLHFYPGEYAWVFILAFFPGLISVLVTYFLPSEPTPQPTEQAKRPFKGIFNFWKKSSSGYRKLLLGFLAFALINSTDMLLLLRAGETGLSAAGVIQAYIFYNIVYTLLSFPLGGLADKIGFKPVFIGGILVYGLTYLGMGLVSESWMVFGLFGLYGAFTAAHDGISKSWLSLHIAPEHKATGLGLYKFLSTLALFLASPILGLIWVYGSGEMAFVTIGGMALLYAGVFAFLLPRNQKQGVA